MALTEFSLIDRFFRREGPPRKDVILGIGDDAALLRVPPGAELVVAIDAMVEGVHFPAGTDPFALGHKALAVNLSDLAAMGAEPAWATLALAQPRADETFLRPFSEGFFSLAERFGVALVGGDTVRGPLLIAVQAHGFVPNGQGLRRSGARVGDRIYVSGTLGDAGAGLAVAQSRLLVDGSEAEYLRGRLDRPEPRVALGVALRTLASAAIDISDGLVADLGHICEASGVGALIEADRLPLSAELIRAVGEKSARELALCSGDDYELCFTLPPDKEAMLSERWPESGCPITAIGEIEADSGVRVRGSDGRLLSLASRGFDHFAAREPT